MPEWGKPSLRDNCQNCNDDPYRLVPWLDPGSCQDTVNNSCYLVKELPIACMAGDPPQPYTCYGEEWLECQIQNCVDGDGDGSPRRPPPGGETCVREAYDCDDTDPNRKPGAIEDCHDLELKDEDCDDRPNCEDEQCWAGQTTECDEQCDRDGDGFYKERCGGLDCNDGSSLAFPGYGQQPHGIRGEASGSNSCADGLDNDCDGNDKIDCADSDCQGTEACEPEPPPPPPPTPGDGEDPCQGDECCLRGTHTECTGGWCDPDIEICWQNPYTGMQECVTYPGDCEPEICVEVCN